MAENNWAWWRCDECGQMQYSDVEVECSNCAGMKRIEHPVGGFYVYECRGSIHQVLIYGGMIYDGISTSVPRLWVGGKFDPGTMIRLQTA